MFGYTVSVILPAVLKHGSYLQPFFSFSFFFPSFTKHQRLYRHRLSADTGAGGGRELLDLVPAVSVVQESYVLVARGAAAWRVVPGLGGRQSAAQAQVGEGEVVVGRHTGARTAAVLEQHRFIRVVAEAKVSYLQHEHGDSKKCKRLRLDVMVYEC